MEKTLVFVDSVTKTHTLSGEFRENIPDCGKVYLNPLHFEYVSEHLSAWTPDGAKSRIIKDFSDPNGIIRILFSTITYGMGNESMLHRATVVCISPAVY
jgi:hypothetical protein